MKKNYQIISLSFLALIAAAFVIQQTWFKDTKKVSFEGVSFQYPKDLRVQEIPSTGDYYKNFQITNPEASTASGRSSITVSLPLKNHEIFYPLAEEISPYADASVITSAELNGKVGERVAYRAEGEFPGDVPVAEDVIRERYPSEFPNSPYSLVYHEANGDNSLNEAWELLHQTLRWD